MRVLAKSPAGKVAAASEALARVRERTKAIELKHAAKASAKGKTRGKGKHPIVAADPAAITAAQRKAKTLPVVRLTAAAIAKAQSKTGRAVRARHA